MECQEEEEDSIDMSPPILFYHFYHLQSQFDSANFWWWLVCALTTDDDKGCSQSPNEAWFEIHESNSITRKAFQLDAVVLKKKHFSRMGLQNHVRDVCIRIAPKTAIAKTKGVGLQQFRRKLNLLSSNVEHLHSWFEQVCMQSISGGDAVVLGPTFFVKCAAFKHLRFQDSCKWQITILRCHDVGDRSVSWNDFVSIV